MDSLCRPRDSKLENLNWCEDFWYFPYNLVFVAEVESIIGEESFYLISAMDGAALSFCSVGEKLPVREPEGHFRLINRSLAARSPLVSLGNSFISEHSAEAGGAQNHVDMTQKTSTTAGAVVPLRPHDAAPQRPQPDENRSSLNQRKIKPKRWNILSFWARKWRILRKLGLRLVHL